MEVVVIVMVVVVVVRTRGTSASEVRHQCLFIKRETHGGSDMP